MNLRNNQNSFSTIRPKGISMFPCLQENDLVIIDKNLAQLEPGDIVLYQGKNHKILHRIVEITQNEIITKGDFNSVNDDPVLFNHIEGKVISVLRNNASVDFSKTQQIPGWKRLFVRIKRMLMLRFRN